MPRPRLLFALTPVLAALGCGGAADAGRTAVSPVEGTITVEGRPAANAQVAFYPAAGGQPRCPVGVTRADGTFRLTTFAADDGAPPGEYVVTVVWPDPANPIDECVCPDPSAHDRLRGRYASAATSDLRATVRPGRNEITLRAVAGDRGWNFPRVRDGAGSATQPPAPK